MNYQLLFRYDAAAGEGGGGSGAGAGEGGGAGAGAGGTEPTITLTEKDLQERLQKHFQNGMTEREKRIMESQIPELFKKHNLTYGKTLEETLASIGETITSSKKDVDQRVLDAEVKISGLSKENKEWLEKYQSKDTEVNNYIIDNELIRAIGGKAVNPSILKTLMRESYKFERDPSSGAIRVFSKATGETVYNNESTPATLEQLAEKYLNENPYLMKTNNTGGTGGSDRTTGGGGNLDALTKKLKNDPASLTDAERKVIYDSAP